VTVVERVADSIRRALVVGRLVPGQRLIEAELTRDFAASRSSIRSALAQLAAEDLIVITPHRGAVVRRMTRRDVEELYRIRERLEALAAAIAAERVASGGVNASLARALAETSRRSAGRAGAEAYAAANQRFHLIIQQLADNRQLARMLERLNLPLFRLQFRSFLKPAAASRSASDHEGIAAAILGGNAAAAERLMRSHVARSARIILSLPDEYFGG
jgi:DNA-binding GntR family transcriptional regulator